MSPTHTLLRELIALPSVNPAFVPASDPRAGEKRVAEFVLASAARAGLDVEVQPVWPDRPNVLARLAPAGKVRQRVALAPHLDTVGAAEMPNSLFEPRLKAGRLHGRGACDTKGSVAAMLTALTTLATSGPRPAQTEIVFAGLVDEEFGQGGSRSLVKNGFTADLAIVGEPTRLELVTAHKGVVRFTISTRGRAAHGARPELGKNAIHAMARVVEVLATDYAALLKRRTHPLLGQATANIGTIQGGVQVNVVPDSCEISLDRRTIPRETEARVRRELVGLLRGRGLDAQVVAREPRDCPPLETDARQPLVNRFLALLGQAEPVGVDYFSDGAVLARGGIPSVVFGPGDIAQAHTADEWISLRSLEAGTALLTRFLRSLP